MHGQRILVMDQVDFALINVISHEWNQGALVKRFAGGALIIAVDIQLDGCAGCASALQLGGFGSKSRRQQRYEKSCHLHSDEIILALN
jgi:hypothetical protein